MIHTIISLYDVVRNDLWNEKEAEKSYFSTNPYDYLK